MNLTILDHKGPTWRTARTKQAVHKIAPMLMSVQRCAALTICVNYSNNIYDNANGTCHEHRDDPTQHARRFTIKLQREMPWSQTVTTLAHELVHASQFASGKLQRNQTYRSQVSWKGGPWEEMENIEHLDRPWEWEARLKEHDLAAAYFKIEEPNWVF